MSDQISILFAKDASQLLEQNKIDEALQLCELGVKQFPLYTEGHFTMARCYEINNQPDDAAREYERALNFIPGHLRALHALAQLHYRKEMYQVGNQLKLSAFLYNSQDEKLARYLTNEGLLPLSPEPETIDADVSTTKPDPVPASVSADDLESVVDPDDVQGEEYQMISDDKPVIYEPQRESAPEPADVEPLFESPEIDRFIADVDSDQPNEAELLQKQDFTIPEPVSQTKAESKPPVIEMDSPKVELPDQPPMEESLFAEPDEPGTVPERTTDDEASKVDLSRYANIKDDFSTLMNDMFVPGQEPESEEEPPATPGKEEPVANEEAVQMAEECPILDTSIIFLEKKQKDISAEEHAADLEDAAKSTPTVQDDNSLASDIAKIPSQGLKEELPISGPASNGQAKSDELNDVIEKIEIANQQRQTGSDKDNQEPQVLDSTAVFEMSSAVEDEAVSIEDIMSNPSLLTSTFGEILIAQKKFENARHVFMELLKKEPENPRFIKKVEFLDKLVAMNK